MDADIPLKKRDTTHACMLTYPQARQTNRGMHAGWMHACLHTHKLYKWLLPYLPPYLLVLGPEEGAALLERAAGGEAGEVGVAEGVGGVAAGAVQQGLGAGLLICVWRDG